MNAGQEHPELLVIANVSAGRSSGRRSEDELEAAMQELRTRATVRVARCRHTRELPAILSSRENCRLVVAGGDGTIHSVVKALLQRRTLSAGDPLGILPLGTGNDLARALDLPLDPAEAARVVLDGVPRALDLLVDDVGGVVINTAHVGVGAEASKAAVELKPLLGSTTYPVAGLMAGMRVKGWRLRILVDDAQLWDSLAGMDGIIGTRDDDDRVLLVGLGNGRTIGGGTPLFPDAELDDGLIDVVVRVATGPLSRLAPTRPAGAGTALESKVVLSARGRRVSVLSQDAAFPLNADGEVETGVHGRTWHLQPGAWAALVPAAEENNN